MVAEMAPNGDGSLASRRLLPPLAAWARSYVQARQPLRLHVACRCCCVVMRRACTVTAWQQYAPPAIASMCCLPTQGTSAQLDSFLCRTTCLSLDIGTAPAKEAMCLPPDPRPTHIHLPPAINVILKHMHTRHLLTPCHTQPTCAPCQNHTTTLASAGTLPQSPKKTSAPAYVACSS